MEEWKAVKNFEGLYEVSDKGRVRSLDRLVHYKNNKKRFWKGVILKHMTQKTGYKTVNLSKNGKQIYKFVHHLVAENFMNHKVSREFPIDHIDHDKDNNTLDNLQILTHRQNISKTTKKYTSKYTGVHFNKNRKGTKNWFAQIKTKGVVKYKSFYNEYDAHLYYQSELKKVI